MITTQRAMERRMLNLSLRDKIRHYHTTKNKCERYLGKNQGHEIEIGRAHITTTRQQMDQESNRVAAKDRKEEKR